MTSAATALAIELGLRTLPLSTLARAVGAPLATEVPPPRIEARSLTTHEQRRLRAARRVLRRWPFGETCLRQALVFGHHLRRHEPRLQVGVAKIHGDVRAHAWLEVSGKVFDPMGSASSYRALEPVRSRR